MPGEVEEDLGVLADVRLGVVAGDVVPLDAVFIQVVEYAQTALGSLVDGELGVVRLGPLVVAGVGPGAVRPVLDGVGGVRGGDFLVECGPEPSVYVDRLQVLPYFAAGKIAKTTGGPDVVEASALDEVLDPVVLCGSLNGDGVHAAQTTGVASLEPVDLLALRLAVGVRGVELVLRQVPREVVVVAAELHVFWSVYAHFFNRK